MAAFPLNGGLAGNESFDHMSLQGLAGVVSLSSDIYAAVEKPHVGPIFIPFVSDLIFY